MGASRERGTGPDRALTLARPRPRHSSRLRVRSVTDEDGRDAPVRGMTAPVTMDRKRCLQALAASAGEAAIGRVYHEADAFQDLKERGPNLPDRVSVDIQVQSKVTGEAQSRSGLSVKLQGHVVVDERPSAHRASGDQAGIVNHFFRQSVIAQPQVQHVHACRAEDMAYRHAHRNRRREAARGRLMLGQARLFGRRPSHVP